MPMVKYWKTSSSIPAKVTIENGALVMKMEGEDETFPGFPRGHSLFGSLSPLKHQIKNQIFNDSWKKLEDGISHDVIISDIKRILSTGLTEFWENVRYDAVPPQKMVKAVKEIWRVLTILEKEEPKIRPIKEMLCFILQEDDAYRFRVQWLFDIFRPRWWINPVKWFSIALTELENAEIIGDMKERQRLLKRILLLILEDKKILYFFKRFCSLVDWKKVRLSKADRYHFRGKWFKTDWMYFEY